MAVGPLNGGGNVYTLLDGESVKQEIVVALQRPEGLLVPFMVVQVERAHIAGFLDAVLAFSCYVPIRALCNGNVITSYDLTREGVAVRGHVLREETT